MKKILETKLLDPEFRMMSDRSNRIHPAFSFSRATTAGYFNANRKYVEAPPNVPRIEYSPLTGQCLGLRVDPIATNYILNSRLNLPSFAIGSNVNGVELSTSSSYVQDNAVTWFDDQPTVRISNPEGFAARFATNTRNAHGAVQCFSIYFRTFAKSNVNLRILAGDTSVMAEVIISFDSNGKPFVASEQATDSTTIGVMGYVEECGDNWYRAGIAAFKPGTSTTIKTTCRIMFSTNTQVWLAAAQLEDSYSFSSWIRTTNTPTTRMPDILTIPKQHMATIVKDDFTIVTDFVGGKTMLGDNHYVFGPNVFYDGNNRCRLMSHQNFWTDPSHVIFSGRLGGNTVTANTKLAQGFTSNSFTKIDRFRTALTFGGGQKAKAALFGKYIGEHQQAGDFSQKIPEAVFCVAAGNVSLTTTGAKEPGNCGHYREIAIFPKRFSDTELLAVTEQPTRDDLYEEVGFA